MLGEVILSRIRGLRASVFPLPISALHSNSSLPPSGNEASWSHTAVEGAYVVSMSQSMSQTLVNGVRSQLWQASVSFLFECGNCALSLVPPTVLKTPPRIYPALSSRSPHLYAPLSIAPRIAFTSPRDVAINFLILLTRPSHCLDAYTLHCTQ